MGPPKTLINVGVIGLGKLGLPIAVALGRSRTVYGYDKNPTLMRKRSYEHREQGLGSMSFQEMFDTSDLHFADLPEVADKCRIIFVAVQTPHLPQYEGVTRIPAERADFDCSHLIAAVRSLSAHVTPETVVVVISTCLPGTIRKHIAPLLKGKCRLVYNPFFIAMGTVIEDFYNPEFILLGSDDKEAMQNMKTFYRDVSAAASGVSRPPEEFRMMSIESAELSKVAYNTYIGMKISYANTMMEIAHKIPHCNIDDVMGAIKSASGRLISPKYLTPGMGDGGGCLIGETLIALLNGTETKIQDLVGAAEFYVYSYNKETHEVVPGRAHSCRKTGTQAPVIRVILDSGESVICTPDHPFLLRNGRYIEARQLKPGDRLMPLYRRATKDSYEETLHPIQNTWERTHRIVHRWKYGPNKSLPVAHHKDFDKRNNHPGNIAAMSRHGHWIFHSEMLKRNPEWREKLRKAVSASDRKRWANAEYRAKMSEMSARLNGSPEKIKQQSRLLAELTKAGKINSLRQRTLTSERNRTQNPCWDPVALRKLSQTMKAVMRRKVAEGVHHTVTNNPSHRLMREGRHNFQLNHPMKDATKKASMVQHLNEFHARRCGFASHSESIASVRKLRYQDGMTVDAMMMGLGVSRRFIYYRLKAGANHYVEAVEDAGRADVYNFEVDVHHNYALSTGLFVHNCHPRDNIAMSWLARKLDLSHDFFEDIMKAREDQAQWLVDLMLETKLPCVILGTAFKPETNIVTGSPSVLCGNLLRERGVEVRMWDPYVDSSAGGFERSVFLIGTRHRVFAELTYPDGSVVIDPHRYIPNREGIRVIHVGIGSEQQTG